MSTPAAMATVTLVWSGVAFLLTVGAIRLVERLMPEPVKDERSLHE